MHPGKPEASRSRTSHTAEESFVIIIGPAYSSRHMILGYHRVRIPARNTLSPLRHTMLCNVQQFNKLFFLHTLDRPGLFIAPD